MAMIIFRRLPDVSINRNQGRSVSSFCLYLALYKYRSHHNIVDRNFACLTFRFVANLWRLVAGVKKVGGVRISCGLQDKKT